MTFGEIHDTAVANGRRVGMWRRIRYGDTAQGRQELYRVLHECRTSAVLPDDIQWGAATYAAGFQRGWDLGWAAGAAALKANGRQEGVGVGA